MRVKETWEKETWEWSQTKMTVSWYLFQCESRRERQRERVTLIREIIHFVSCKCQPCQDNTSTYWQHKYLTVYCGLSCLLFLYFYLEQDPELSRCGRVLGIRLLASYRCNSIDVNTSRSRLEDIEEYCRDERFLSIQPTLLYNWRQFNIGQGNVDVGCVFPCDTRVAAQLIMAFSNYNTTVL